MINKQFANSRSKFCFKEYYKNYDLLNKYNVLSISKVPKIKKISLSFNLRNFQVYRGENFQTDTNLQVKTFLLFFAFLSITPYVKVSLKKKKSGKSIDENNDLYCLKIVIIKKQDINEFMQHLSFNGYNVFQVKNSFENTTLNYQVDTFSTNFSIPASVFLDVNDYENSVIKNQLFENSKFDLTVTMFSKHCTDSRVNFLKNLLSIG
jgi:hypothetical protein